MTRFLDKYIIYYADRWETTHRLSFALTGLSLYLVQLLYMLWAIFMLPVVIYLLVTLFQQNKYIDLQAIHAGTQQERLVEQNIRVTELHNSQLQALQYKTAVDAYYNELIKSRGFEEKGFITEKIGPNSFELKLQPPD